jgi:hypothetical protein
MTPHAQAMQRLRAKRRAAGLTSKGFEPVNRRHPELAGLTGKEYHTAYMRKQRTEDRENYEHT